MRAAANYILKANNSNSQLEAKLPTTLFSDAGHGGGSPGEQGGQDRRWNRGEQRMREEKAGADSSKNSGKSEK